MAKWLAVHIASNNNATFDESATNKLGILLLFPLTRRLI